MQPWKCKVQIQLGGAIAAEKGKNLAVDQKETFEKTKESSKTERKEQRREGTLCGRECVHVSSSQWEATRSLSQAN